MKGGKALMTREQSEDTVAAIVEFCRFLRKQGIACGSGQALVALQAARTEITCEINTFCDGLRAVLCAGKEEWDRFPELFEAFWGELQQRPRSAAGERRQRSNEGDIEQKNNSVTFLEQLGSVSTDAQGEGKAVFGASAQERLKKMDFSSVRADDLAALEELASRLLRRASQRLSRRLSRSNIAGPLDIRRTVRSSIARGGEPFALHYRQRKPRKTRLVLLLDISGSMNFYSSFFVRFAYALQARIRMVHTFLFSTNLVEISDLLRTHDLNDALSRLAQHAAGWAGGTRIGESLRQFGDAHGRKLLTRDTVFMILSDGWDTGEPQVLAAQMRMIRSRTERVLWLNPLLGMKDYEPVTRCMAAALPHVDIFAPAHNLESLLALEKYF